MRFPKIKHLFNSHKKDKSGDAHQKKDGGFDSVVVDVTLAKELTWFDGLMIGVGGMIGGGIFSVIGLSTKIAGPAVIISFILGGLIALTTGVCYVALSQRYPYSGATFVYVREAFNNRFISSWIGWLLWSGYTILCSLYAFSCGAYAKALTLEAFPFFAFLEVNIPIYGVLSILQAFYSTILILLFLWINLIGVSESASIQQKIVLTKILILIFFSITGIIGIYYNFQSGKDYFSPFFPGNVSLIPNGAMLIIIGMTMIFVAFEGLELVPNSAEEMVDTETSLRKAIYGSVLLVWVIYILVAFVLVGNLAYSEIANDPEIAEYALAEAAKPLLGLFGFAILGIGAIFSTASAFNASLYGSSRLAYNLGENKVFPKVFSRVHSESRVPDFSLKIIAVLSIILALTGSIEQIASLGASAFIVVFILVNLSAIILNFKGEIKIRLIIPIIGIILCTTAIITMIFYFGFNQETQDLNLLLGICVYLTLVSIAGILSTVIIKPADQKVTI